MIRIFWILTFLFIAGCAVQSSNTSGDCYYSQSNPINIDSVQVFRDELARARASKDTIFLMLSYSPTRRQESGIHITLSNGRVNCFKLSANARKEIILTKEVKDEIHRALSKEVIPGSYWQHCTNTTFDGSANFIAQIQGQNELLYFSPYDSPLQLNSESRRLLGYTFRLIEVATSLYWKK